MTPLEIRYSARRQKKSNRIFLFENFLEIRYHSIVSKSLIFLYFCLSFVGGIFVSSVFSAPKIIIFGFLVCGVAIFSVFWKKWNFVVVGFCLIFLVFGILRHQSVVSAIKNDSLSVLRDSGEIIILTGIVSDDPEIKSDKLRLKIKTDKLKTRDSWRKISGEILITLNRYPEHKYGDKLEITGKIQTPSEDISGFNYKDYLSKDGIYSVMYFPKTVLLESGRGNPAYKILFSFKNRLKNNFESLFLPPQVGIMEALIFGDEEKIPQDLKDKLNIVGVRHITAVSGMNITIISGILMGFLIGIGLWRNQAFYFSAVIITLYILMIGAPASAVRAGIMAGIFMLARQIGRPSSAGRAIVFASTLMLALNPLLLRLDVGFQLSFLAMLGMVLLQPYFCEKFSKLPNIFGFREIISITLATQIFTLPILVYNFGRISVFSLPANILILPVIAPLTVAGFFSGLFVFIWHSPAWVLSFPIWLGLSYIVKIVDWFSFLPFSSYTVKNINWVWLPIWYFGIGYFIWCKIKKNRKDPES